MRLNLIRFVFRLLLAAVFGTAALSKLYSDFFQQEPPPRTVYSRYFPSGSKLDASLIASELFLAIWLGSGLKLPVAVTIAIGALSLYTGVLGVEVSKPHPLPCGCLGEAARAAALNDAAAVRRGLWLSIGRNGLLMAGGVWLLLSTPRRTKASTTHEPTIEMIPSSA